MKLLVDEMPMSPEDCSLFSSGDCKLDGKTCRMRNGEECNCLNEFRPFTFEPQFKATFSTRDLPDINPRYLQRRFDILADAIGLERTTDPREILDTVIKKFTKLLPRNTGREIVCPSCGVLIGSCPYCGYCGQAIDQSKTEEKTNNEFR